MNELFRKIDSLAEQYFRVWEDVANIESPTAYKEGNDRVGAYFAAMARERGWKVEIGKQEVAGDVVCITMNPDAEAAPIVLSGHLDTVHPVGTFGTPAVHRDEEKIYGPGVTDCKGGVVAAMMAMDALRLCGFTKRPVKLLLQTDEETSCRTSGGKTIRYMYEQSKDAVVFLNLESYTPHYATLSRKGILSYRFDIEGKAGHSSRCVTEGANAIVDASYKMIELDKFKDDGGITCNCGLVSGGTAVNSIAAHCTFYVNFRYATNAQLTFIETFVQKLAQTQHVPGCSCTYEKIATRPTMEKCERNEQVLERVNEIFGKYGIPQLTGRMLRGGSDAAYITQYGIPCMDSLGTEGGGTHSVNEYAKLESLPRAAKRMVAIVHDF